MWGIIGLGWLGQELSAVLSLRGSPVWGTHRATFTFGRDSFPAAPFDVLFLNTPPLLSLSPEEFVDQIKLGADSRLIFISSTSVFGRDQDLCDETTTPIPSTANGRWLVAVEDRLRRQFASQLLLVRPGGLIGGQRHPVHSLSQTGQAQGGEDPINLIHRNDLIEIILRAHEDREVQLINAVTPHHPKKREYYNAWSQRLGLPAIAFPASTSASSPRLIESVVLPRIYPQWLCPQLDFL